MVPYDAEHIKDWVYTGFLGLVAITVSAVIARITLFNKDKDRLSIEKFSVIYTNCGFMGIPLIKGVFGDRGLFFVSSYFAVFGIMLFTHGEMMIKSDGSKAGLKDTLKSVWNAVKSPPIVATAIGAVFFFSRIQVPHILGDFIGYLASLTTPLAMLVAGVMISQTNLKVLLRNARLYYISFIKLMLIPAVTMIIFYFLPHDYLPMGAALISTACSSATFGVMLAVKHNKESIYATEIFAITTILCIITIPAVMVLFDQFFKSTAA
jgi:predicted permease